MNIFNKLFSHSYDEEDSEFALGKKFPWKGYNAIGDHVSVALNETSFDVVISLTGLSEDEKKAIGHDEFEVFVAATDLVPFIIIKFGNVFKADMTINIKKMNEAYRDTWLASNDKVVRIFLLEGSCATLECVRTFEFECMHDMKELCKNQMAVDKNIIDDHINSVYQLIPIEQMIQIAQVNFVVPSSISL